MYAGGRFTVDCGIGARCAQPSGNGVFFCTGYTNIDDGSAFCTVGLSMKSTSLRAPATLGAPLSTPTYSTCRKQLSSNALVPGVAAGDEAYDSTIGLSPLPSPAVKSWL